MGYTKVQKIQCHYGKPNPYCEICHGSGIGSFDLPCDCRMSNMTFDQPEEILEEVIVEPLPDGGARIHLREVKPEQN